MNEKMENICEDAVLVTCDCCGAIINEDEGLFIEEQILCPDCVELETSTFCHCDTRVFNRDIVDGYHDNLCYNCFDNFFHKMYEL